MDGHEPTIPFEPLTRTDIVLAALTFPLLLFVMMFAVTGTTHLLNTRRQRLRIGLALVAVEAAIVALIVAVAT